jgi:hypothetical protein
LRSRAPTSRPPSTSSPIATRVEAGDWEDDEDFDDEEIDDAEELDYEGVSRSLAAGYEQTIVLMREALDNGDAREKFRAMGFFAKEAAKRRLVGNHPNGRDDTVERFLHLMAEIRDVGQDQKPSASAESASFAGGLSEPIVDSEHNSTGAIFEPTAVDAS